MNGTVETVNVSSTVRTEAAESIHAGPQFNENAAQAELISASPWGGLSTDPDCCRTERHRRRLVEVYYNDTVEWQRGQDKAVCEQFAPALYRAAVDDKTGHEKPLDKEAAVRKMVERSLADMAPFPDMPAVRASCTESLSRMLATTQRRLAEGYKAVVTRTEKVMQDFAECELGGIVTYHGRWATKFNYGLNRIETDVLDVESSSETTERFEKGLILNRTIETTKGHTATSIETRSIAEKHDRTLIAATRERMPFSGVPKRVRPVVEALPFFLREQACMFSSDRFVMHVSEETLSRCVETLRKASVDVRVMRSVNAATLSKIVTCGMAALITGGAIAATVVLVPIAFIVAAISAIPSIDPCIAVGKYVIAGWAPDEK